MVRLIFYSRINRFLEQELTQSDPRMPMRDFRDKIERWDYDTNNSDWREQEGAEDWEPAVPAALLPESLAEFERHTAFLLESAEYKWLQWQLKALVTLDPGTDNMSRVRNTLLEAMPDILRLNQAVDVELHLTLPWDPTHFLKEQFPTATRLPLLGSVITICGSPLNPYATTCREYILQMWPTYGEKALLMAQNCIVEKQDSHESGSTETSQSKFRLSGTYLETIEKLKDEHEFSQTVAFSLQCDMVGLDVDQKAGCWRDMFRNPVLALGYPVPIRTHGEAGLEMSALMLVTVGRVPWATVFDGGLVLKGFSTMAVAVERIGSSVLWHFMARKDGDRIAYHERDCMARLSNFEEAFFSGARHFVAWTVAAELLVGEQAAFATSTLTERALT
jgi:hypothetical protein